MSETFLTPDWKRYESIIFQSSITSTAVHAGQIAGLEEKEAAAVEAEDFESAAILSADLDSLKAQAAHVQADIRSADAACDHAVQSAASRWFLLRPDGLQAATLTASISL